MSRFSRRRAAWLRAVGVLFVVSLLVGLLAPMVPAAPAFPVVEPPPRPDLPPLPPPPASGLACAEISPVECDTLVDFYNQMNGPNWTNTQNGVQPWLATNTPCVDWYGVTCAVLDGQLRVTGLRLIGEDPLYGGNYPGNNLRGPIPTTIGNLSYLLALDLGFNNLGAPIPPEIGHLKRLVELLLSNAVLTGELPPQLGLLESLQVLDLHGSHQFVGTLPPELGLLTNLRVLNLGQWGAQFGGQLPPELALLTNLEYLSIFALPGLAGPIPDLSSLTKLETLLLPYNNLTGPFPAWLDDLPNLIDIALAGNALTGAYPTVFSSNKLRNLSLSPAAANQGVPEWIADLTELEHLELSSGGNGGFTGPFPTYVADMDQLVTLSITGNDFDPAVMPASLWRNPNLTSLQLYDDTLRLSIPADAGAVDLPQLGTLLLSGPTFTGNPSALRQATDLQWLQLSNTAFEGGLDWLMDLKQLTYVELPGNRFTGPLPVGWATMGNMVYLAVERNHLSGLLPADLADAPKLRALNVGYNALDATDPGVLQLLANLNDGWRTTQTLPPIDVAAEALATGARLTWTPPVFQGGPGRYRITATPQPGAGDPFHPNCLAPRAVETPLAEGKGLAEFTVTGLCPNTAYDFRVETITLPYPDQQNELVSGPSAPAAAETAITSLHLVAVSLEAAEMTEKYEHTLAQAMHAGLMAGPGAFTVLLVDLYGKDNTAIYLLAGEQPLPIDGLPDPRRLEDGVPQLNPTLLEYDMGNSGVLAAGDAGNHLGAFIKWAIATYAPANTVPVTFSFIGHGVALAPTANNLYCIFADRSRPQDAPECFSQEARAAAAGLSWTQPPYPPLPTQVDINPTVWTDATSHSMITPYTLSEALRMGTDAGERPLVVLDVVHCFGGTIEELYEVAYPWGSGRSLGEIVANPHAEVIIGSPNYAYFAPDLAMRALLAVDFAQEPETIAAAMLEAYDTALAAADGYDNDPGSVEHPRVLVAVDARAGSLVRVKEAMDALAGRLVAHLRANHATARGHIEAAHKAAQHYDTTLCRPQDWRLDAEDGLSDFALLLKGLEGEFGDDPAVAAAAAWAGQQVDAAVIATKKAGGVPWFADANPGAWAFADEALGLAIYADFVGVSDPAGGQAVGWQGYWYTSGPFDAPLPHYANRHPLAFNRPAGEEAYTWADVLRVYWQGPDGSGQVPAWACTTALPNVRDRAVFVPIVEGRQ